MKRFLTISAWIVWLCTFAAMCAVINSSANTQSSKPSSNTEIFEGPSSYTSHVYDSYGGGKYLVDCSNCTATVTSDNPECIDVNISHNGELTTAKSAAFEDASGQWILSGNTVYDGWGCSNEPIFTVIMQDGGTITKLKGD